MPLAPPGPGWPPAFHQLPQDERFFARILQRNGLVPDARLYEAVQERASTRRPLLDVVVLRGLLPADQVAKVREAQATSQVVRLDSVYADIVLEQRLASRDTIEAAFLEQRARRFKARLGEILVERRVLSPEVHKAVVSELLRRARVAAEARESLLGSAADRRGLAVASSLAPVETSTSARIVAPVSATPPARGVQATIPLDSSDDDTRELDSPLALAGPRARAEPARPAAAPPPPPPPPSVDDLLSRDPGVPPPSVERAPFGLSDTTNRLPAKPPLASGSLDGRSFLVENVERLRGPVGDRPLDHRTVELDPSEISASAAASPAASSKLLASALELHLSSEAEAASIPLLDDGDRELLESDIARADEVLASGETPAAKLERFARTGSMPGGVEKFVPDLYLARKRRRRKIATLVGLGFAALGLVGIGALIGRAVGRSGALKAAREAVKVAEAALPSDALPLWDRADAAFERARAARAGTDDLRALERLLAAGRARAEVELALAARRADDARAALARADERLDPEDRAALDDLRKRVAREKGLAAGEAAEAQDDFERAAREYRDVVEKLGDPDGRGRARIEALRARLRSEAARLEAVAERTFDPKDEEAFARAAKRLYELFQEDRGLEERRKDLSFARHLQTARRALEKGEGGRAEDEVKAALGIKETEEARRLLARARDRRVVEDELRRVAESERAGRYGEAIDAAKHALQGELTPAERVDLEQSLERLKARRNEGDRAQRREAEHKELVVALRRSDADAAIAAARKLDELQDPDAPVLVAFARSTRGMVFVPPGEFLMGSDDGAGVKPIHRPKRTLDLVGYFIDRTEVTNRAWAEFVDATGRAPPDHWTERVRRPDGSIKRTFTPGTAEHPVVNVSWQAARDYASWTRKRLPTEPEWEKAARGSDGRTYPWGEGTRARARVDVPRSSSAPDTAPVGTHPDDKSPYGVLDMAGNASEWVEDVFKPYPGAPAGASATPGYRTIRGGAFRWSFDDARCYARSGAKEDYASPDVGFRCVLDVPHALSELRTRRR